MSTQKMMLECESDNLSTIDDLIRINTLIITYCTPHFIVFHPRLDASMISPDSYALVLFASLISEHNSLVFSDISANALFDLNLLGLSYDNSLTFIKAKFKLLANIIPSIGILTVQTIFQKALKELELSTVFCAPIMIDFLCTCLDRRDVSFSQTWVI
jgi:hypothetical protein